MKSLGSGAVLAIGAVLTLAGTARTQDAFISTGDVPMAAVAEENWGTVTDSIYTAFAHEFNLFQGTAAPMNPTTAGLVCATAPCGWLGSLHLPSGASIRSVELSACDGDAVQQVQFALFRAPKVPGGPIGIVPFQGTGGAAAPGCTTFSFTLATPHTVDNDANVYILDVLENPGTNIQWNQFRVRYRLQVSPAPATATFTDVPVGSGQHRFVEALVAAGVTGGCGSGLYCPNDPVTRGQMAVFLSVALGMHFAN